MKTKIFSVAVILFLCLSGIAFAHSAENRFWGEVPVDMLLTGDVLIVRTLIVPEDVTLTIDPGTVVRFEKSDGGANRILVRGSLVAVGAPDKPIKFIPKDGGSGPWFGIEFEGNGKGRLEHCVLQGASSGVRGPKGRAVQKDVKIAR